ncbi:MAG: DNA mismatch repair endonuclease MutL [Prevotella sp.]|nr:DNA mismatch repair endonuclease MutL [Prevotella sp.]
MSDVIQLLPDSVANQIAAGEVIQRPASVIKELVENAVDAGATTINVLVVDAGRTLIQVIDNGKGMSDTDARLAFERHATSKIKKADDLFALQTMGFRGEALASIAAVAQVELTTRMKGSELGSHVSVAGSKVLCQEPVSCPEGSNFRVENLFYNVPARRKFLKTNATELNNILVAFERIVLVYPDINFTLHSNGSELLNLHSGSLRQRISDVFGKRYNQDLLPISVDTAMCKVTGYVGKPETARKKGAHEYFFVNGRYMKHPYFHKAVANAYERLIPVGMLTPYFIYLDVSPADIDVNIHPTKTEIKFENEQAIWQIITAAVKDALGKFCEIPSIDFDTEGKPDIPAYNPGSNVVPPQLQYNPTYNPFRQTKSKAQSLDGWETLYEGLDNNKPVQQDFFGPLGADDMAEEHESATIIEDKSPTHYQYKATYIMTAVKSGLMIIDQHRADVRIRYERYLSQLQSKVSSTQRLLFPEAVQFSPSEIVMLHKILPELAAVGFELSDLGGNCYAINGIPAGLEGLNPVSLLMNIVNDAIESTGDTIDDVHKTLAHSLARNAAIPCGQLLTNVEMENIVNELFACSNVNYTPDGKTILCILPQRDIEQLLG